MKIIGSELGVDEPDGSSEADVRVVEVAETAERTYGEDESEVLEDEERLAVNVILSHPRQSPVSV